ncbi:alcohol dehydrogenase 1, partial [Hyaloraphidium curvatum]
IPKVGRAGVCTTKGEQFVITAEENYPVPEPKAGELLLRLNCTGLCHSDVHVMLQDWGMPMGCDCTGHEGAGVVVKVGEGVEGWKVGDRAGVKPVMDVCHVCEFCRNGMETACSKAVATGVIVNGSYAQYLVSPARYTTRIPEGVSDLIAGPIMCSGATVWAALKKAGTKPGDWVVIPGAGGGVGHFGVQYAKILGCRIVAIDSGKDKEELCKSLGAEVFIDFKEVKDIPAKVQEVTGGGAHAVVVTGGTKSAYEPAPFFLRQGGTMVCVGLPTAGTTIAGADPMYMCMKRLTIRGSMVGSMSETDEALAFAARGLVKPVFEVFPFKDFHNAVQKLKK